MKNTIIKRIFSIFLGTIILTTTILAASLPITDIPVYAADTKNMLTSPEVLGTDVNTDNMQIVGYAGKQWYVIGYGSNGNCAKADANGGITLFSKGRLDNNIDFNPESNKVNTYKDSILQNYIDNTVYDTFGVAEKVAVITRNLEGGSGNYYTSTNPFYDNNKIAGDPVDNAALWPLSVAEAEDLPSDNIRKAGLWWLRSPGADNESVALVLDDNGDVHPIGHLVYPGTSLTVRPAFYLNPECIIFTSTAAGGKNPGTEGDGTLNQVGTVSVAANTEWKLTLIDSTRSGFSAARVDRGNVAAGDSIKVRFSGAGNDAGEYVSAVLVSSSATSDLLYYGHIATHTAASGDAGVDVAIPAGLADGTYILKVFSEKVNTTAHTTDLASNPESNKITITVKNEYDLVYDKNGGSGNMTSTKVSIGDTYTFPQCAFTPPSNKKFDHWEISGVDGVYQPNEEVEIADNCISDGKITVTAYWVDADQVATPAFSPAGGTFSEAQDVTVSCSTNGAEIYYTTDNSTPSKDNGTRYTSPINVSKTTTIKAIAVKVGMTDSGIGTASYTISADPIKVTGVSVSPTEITLKPEATKKLTATVEPEDATDKDVTWKSDDESIAKVSDDGTVTAVAEGETTIIVTTKDGNKTATCKVIVKKDAPETCTISFDANGGKGEMDPQTVDKGTSTKLKKNKFTREGYAFDSWNTQADGKGKSYKDKDEITVEEDTTLYAQWKEGEPDDDDDDHSDHTPPSWVLNPNEKQQLVITFAGNTAGLTAGYQEQGETAQALFKKETPAGWQKAFSFNILKDGKPDSSLKQGTLTLIIPTEYQKPGRQFAILAMGKNGNVVLLSDTDTSPNTITVALNIEGYAFELIYKD